MSVLLRNGILCIMCAQNDDHFIVRDSDLWMVVHALCKQSDLGDKCKCFNEILKLELTMKLFVNSVPHSFNFNKAVNLALILVSV